MLVMTPGVLDDWPARVWSAAELELRRGVDRRRRCCASPARACWPRCWTTARPSSSLDEAAAQAGVVHVPLPLFFTPAADRSTRCGRPASTPCSPPRRWPRQWPALRWADGRRGRRGRCAGAAAGRRASRCRRARPRSPSPRAPPARPRACACRRAAMQRVARRPGRGDGAAGHHAPPERAAVRGAAGEHRRPDGAARCTAPTVHRRGRWPTLGLGRRGRLRRRALRRCGACAAAPQPDPAAADAARLVRPPAAQRPARTGGA